MKKKFLTVVVILASLLTFCCGAFAATGGELDITVFNVGKGDCILLRQGGRAMMIDTGYKETIDAVISEMRRMGVTSLDCLILSHYDKDHVGGAPALLDQMKVGTIYAPDYRQDNGKAYINYRESLKKRSIKPVLLHGITDIQVGKLYVTMYPPHVHKTMLPNDQSVVCSVKFREKKFLFMGDATDQRMTDLIAELPHEKYDVMKVPHHGFFLMKSKPFKDIFRFTDPAYCVITDAQKYADKGGARELDLYFELCRSKTFRLRNGEIKIFSDGLTVGVSQN